MGNDVNCGVVEVHLRGLMSGDGASCAVVGRTSADRNLQGQGSNRESMRETKGLTGPQWRKHQHEKNNSMSP
jgi:hypothetical protein